MFAAHLIHPMLVHFPIALFILLPILDSAILIRGGNLAARSELPTLGTIGLVIGETFTLAAVVLGGVAAMHAVGNGFSSDAIVAHSSIALATCTVFLLLAVVRVVSRWRNISLAATRGWIFVGATLLGVVLLLRTAYLGGHLVYILGVNVTGITP